VVKTDQLIALQNCYSQKQWLVVGAWWLEWLVILVGIALLVTAKLRYASAFAEASVSAALRRDKAA